MVFSKIEVVRANKGAFGEIIEQNRQEILLALNSSNYHNREVPEEEMYVTPGTLETFDECHATVRKFIEVNEGWEKVSGYLILRSDLTGNTPITLKTHSVVKDVNGKLLEMMVVSYPIEKYAFICHTSGSQGYILTAY